MKSLITAHLLLYCLLGLSQTTHRVITKEYVDSIQTGTLIEEYNPSVRSNPDKVLSPREEKSIVRTYECTYVGLPARHTYSYFNDTLVTEFIDFILEYEENIPKVEQWVFNTFGEPFRPPTISYISDSTDEVRYIKKRKYFAVSDPPKEIVIEKLSYLCMISIETSDYTKPIVSIQVDYFIMNEINQRFK